MFNERTKLGTTSVSFDKRKNVNTTSVTLNESTKVHTTPVDKLLKDVYFLIVVLLWYVCVYVGEEWRMWV